MKREPGLDLLRCTALLFVNALHAFLKNGFYGEPQVGGLIWAADSWRWLFFSCNGLFLLLTGYLKSTKPFQKGYYRSLLPILIGYVLTCCITYPIRHFYQGEQLLFREWLGNLFSFSNYAWYLEMYIGLILISPAINYFLENLKTKRELLMAAGGMLLLTAAPTLTSLPVLPDYWTGLYPVTFYVVGGVIKRLQPEIKLWQGIVLTGILVMLMGCASLISTDKAFSEGFIQSNGGFWNTMVSVLVFLTLYRVKLPQWAAKTIAWLAGGCMEGYLLSLVLDRSLYAAFRPWHSPEHYGKLFLCVTVPIFLISIMAGKAVHVLAEKCSFHIRSIRKSEV